MKTTRSNIPTVRTDSIRNLLADLRTARDCTDWAYALPGSTTLDDGQVAELHCLLDDAGEWDGAQVVTVGRRVYAL